MMKPSSIFMNIGRGVTVKESDLVDALKAKVIAGAVLDVFEVTRDEVVHAKNPKAILNKTIT